MNISGNTVLITGGATGIGYSLAEAFITAGSEVIICGRREERLLEAQKKLPQLHIKVCDVADETDRVSLFKWATTEFPQLNVLVNNAGIQRDIDFTKGTEELIQGESEIRINLEAPVYLSALFIPHLASKKEPVIINVSSGLGFLPMARVPVYCATKAALHSFSMTLRHQLEKLGIKVIEVIPPMVDTELNMEGREKSKMQFRGVKTEEYVASVIKGLEKDEIEIGFGMTEETKKASRADLELRFQQMNKR